MALPLPGYQSMGQMIQNRLDQGLQNRLQQEQFKNALIKNKFAEPAAQAELDKAQLANQLYVPTTQATNSYKNAMTNKLNFNAENPLLGQSGTAGQLAAAEYIRSHPGAISDPNAIAMINRSIQNQQTSSLGAGAQEELFFQNLVSKDNPQLKTQDQIYEASNALREGRTTLNDGTKLNPLSKASSASFDRLTKGTTTAGALNPLIAANQADAEINAISEYAQKGLEPYGDTILNYSPDQVMDTFKSDKKSQEKLGRFIAAQQLQYEIAQNEIKLASGQPGITSTQELMSLGGQAINTMYPKLSYQARKEAQRYFLEALSHGLEARKKAGISPTKALQTSEGEKPSTAKEAIKKTAEEFKGESLQMKGPDGKVYNVPQGKAQRFIENGFKRVG